MSTVQAAGRQVIPEVVDKSAKTQQRPGTSRDVHKIFTQPAPDVNRTYEQPWRKVLPTGHAVMADAVKNLFVLMCAQWPCLWCNLFAGDVPASFGELKWKSF